MNAQPAITTLPCGCFFQGRDMIISAQCEEHTEYEPEDEQTEFKFSELSDRAKEKARSDYRASSLDYDWWDSVHDDADTIAAMMGIDIDRKPVKLMGGGTRHDPAIYFSGFWSQGDGACFEGTWSPLSDPMAALTKVMEHAPLDTDLHEIAFQLAHMSERCNALIPDAYVKVSHSGRYSHSGSTSFDVDLPTPDHIEEGNDLQRMVWNALVEKHGLTFNEFEEEASGTLRAFMDWMYEQLNEEYDYLTSDENIDQYLEELTFDEDGDEV